MHRKHPFTFIFSKTILRFQVLFNLLSISHSIAISKPIDIQKYGIITHQNTVFLDMNISENSRVWIYQANRIFTQEEETAILQILNHFTSEWLAHGHALAAMAEVLHHQFIVLSVDEQVAGATGCSIDKSVNLMKEIEMKFNLNLFDRFRIAFKIDEEVINCSREEFEAMIKSGRVNQNTLVFNNLINSRHELQTAWEIPLKDSWHSKVFSF